ncbi:MAG: universal stress protein [Desulfobacterales bacterium]|nr:universal stress protein [Desulfobacterales bacterium]
MQPEIKKILYATDLSTNSAFAFRYAVYLAKMSGAEIIILHVVEKVSPDAQLALLAYLDKKDRVKVGQERVAKAIERIRKRLEVFCQKELGDENVFDPGRITIDVREGYPAEAILRQVEKRDCDAIIMGAHEKGLRHTFLGSVAKSVLRRCRKPTFVVPLPEDEIDLSMHDE